MPAVDGRTTSNGPHTRSSARDLARAAHATALRDKASGVVRPLGAGVSLRRKIPPRRDHEQTEHRVGGNEHPEWRLVVQKALNPVFNEARAVGDLPCLLAQPRLQNRQRAKFPEPGLCDYDADRCDVRKAEPQVVDPAPRFPTTTTTSPPTTKTTTAKCKSSTASASSR